MPQPPLFILHVLATPALAPHEPGLAAARSPRWTGRRRARRLGRAPRPAPWGRETASHELPPRCAPSGLCFALWDVSRLLHFTRVLLEMFPLLLFSNLVGTKFHATVS